MGAVGFSGFLVKKTVLSQPWTWTQSFLSLVVFLPPCHLLDDCHYDADSSRAQDKSILFAMLRRVLFLGGVVSSICAVYWQPQLEGNLHSTSKSGIGAILAAGCAVSQESSLKKLPPSSLTANWHCCPPPDRKAIPRLCKERRRSEGSRKCNQPSVTRLHSSFAAGCSRGK